jgi:putative SOS response-associated peptidase YedK
MLMFFGECMSYVLVDNFYEPSYESGKAERWPIELASGDPFGIACLWDRWTDPA